MKRFHAIGTLTTIFIIAVVALPVFSKTQIASTMLWVTPEEAAMKDIPASDLPSSKAFLMGPKILVKSPKDGNSYSPPVPIEIQFVARGRAPINLASLKVKYLKWMFVKDITDKVKEYVTKQGIYVPSAPLPPGKHTVEITLADSNKNESSCCISFEVLSN